jgi:hypothetical protein
MTRMQDLNLRCGPGGLVRSTVMAPATTTCLTGLDGGPLRRSRFPSARGSMRACWFSAAASSKSRISLAPFMSTRSSADKPVFGTRRRRPNFFRTGGPGTRPPRLPGIVRLFGRVPGQQPARRDRTIVGYTRQGVPRTYRLVRISRGEACRQFVIAIFRLDVGSLTDALRTRRSAESDRARAA